MLTGNDFIELLYLPIEDNKVKNMMSEFNIEKPVIDKEFKEDGGKMIPVNNFNVELSFKDGYIYNSSKYIHGEIIFGGISFLSNTKVFLPFSLSIGDSYEDIIKKLGKRENYTNKILK